MKDVKPQGKNSKIAVALYSNFNQLSYKFPILHVIGYCFTNI